MTDLALCRFQTDMDILTSDLVNSSAACPDIGLGLQGIRTKFGVSIADYNIYVKKVVIAGFKKNIYSVLLKNHVEYDNIGLVESAIGIVKHLMYTHRSSSIQQILEFDAAYISLIYEMYNYKTKLSSLVKNTSKYDIINAKYTSCMSRLHTTKSKIMSATKNV